ncbi:hypothetical protein ACFV23_40735, partial [Streptomyces sp. NPDC059627]
MIADGAGGLTDDSRLYFEDIPLERVFRTSGRTVTESDVVGFAGGSGAWNSLHGESEAPAGPPQAR